MAEKPVAARHAWEPGRGKEVGALWTELGSPIGQGLADWDLEAFLRNKNPHAMPERTDLGCPRPCWVACQGDPCPAVDGENPPNTSSTLDQFWDADSEFEEENLTSAMTCCTETAAVKRKDGRDLDSLSAGSLSESEELDRWMTGSQSQSTEDSTVGSPASSTLDFTEWTSLDALLGQHPGPGQSLSLGIRLGLVRKPKADHPSWVETPAASEVPSGGDQDSKKTSLWNLCRLVSSAPQASTLKESRLLNHSSAYDQSCADLPSGASNRYCQKPDESSVEGLNGLESLEASLTVAAEQASTARPDGVVCRESEAYFEMFGESFTSTPAEPSEGTNKEVLDLIPDSDLQQLVQQVQGQEGEMLQMPEPRSTQTKNPRSSWRSNQIVPVDVGTRQELQNESSSDDKDEQGQWKLMMRKNTEFMEYSSWVRDKGMHFGGVEFRGRMLLMPKPAGDDNTSSGKQRGKGKVNTGLPGPNSCGAARWGPEAVRDFLLDEVHRAEWDESRELSVMLEDWDESGCSTAQWVRKLPLFLRSREYVVGRRVWRSPTSPRTYYCISKNTEHPSAPPSAQRVRVSRFYSSWRVRPLSVEETQQQRLLLLANTRNSGKVKKQRKEFSKDSLSAEAESLAPGSSEEAVEIITHYEEHSGLPKDLVRMGVAHSMWGHMLKMEHALRSYCASGRNLRHLLPVSLLQAEQQSHLALGCPVMKGPLNVQAEGLGRLAEDATARVSSDIDLFLDCIEE